jgi:adenine deaminase
MGKTAEQYALAGISTDHECFTKEEALNKINCGMKILIREGSAAKNFEALIGLLDEFPDQVMFCSDDKHPNELMRGHMDEIARRAVAKGVSAMKVLRALSLNPIRHYDLNVGLLQAGDAADFIVVDNLVDFRVLKTCINGKQVALDGKSLINRVNEQVVNNFNCEPISLEDLRLKALSNQIRVIEVFDGQLITGQQEFIFNKQEQELKSDTRADVLKLVVVNRYEKAKPAMAFVRDFGLKKGAIASSVAHDSHNIIAVGVSDEEILKAINSVIDEKGGISYADDDLIEVLPLPVAGIMSANAGELVAAAYEKLDALAKKAGSELSAPYMTLSFLALLVIPNLKLSDKGLFDGREFKFTPLFLE